MAEIRLEIPAENSVYEILYDGTERHVEPPTLSENLTQLARKVDFGLSEVEEIKTEHEEEEEDKSTLQQKSQFNSVKDKIKNAWTEMCVLHDLLQILMVKEKPYMMFEPVQTHVSEPKLYLQFFAVKKSMSGAAQVLISAAQTLTNSSERLQPATSDMPRPRPTQDFHLELLKLRQNWKLKKVRHAIVGDLSYRSAGSTFKHSGTFEVTKADDVPSSPFLMGAGMSPGSPLPTARMPPPSSLRVTVPAELEGSSYIFVCIQKDEEDLCSARVECPSSASRDADWQFKLEAAQNVLFCKELFNQLAREAVSLQPPIPHLVVGNQITATIFPAMHLIIALCHSDSEKKRPYGSSGINGLTSHSGAPPSGLSKDINQEVLEHSLHQLLYHSFVTNSNTALPHPAYGPIGIPKKRWQAGPMGADKNMILQATKSETLLEQIINQAQHNFIRLRSMCIIDQLAKETKDPLIISHWNLFNSPTQSCVKINIVTEGYDCVHRSTLVIHIYTKTLKCICRDGTVMTLSFEPPELRNLLLVQISLHNVAAVQSFARFMGWTVISSENNLGVGPMEPLGNASVVVLASPTANQMLAIRSSPTRGVTVSVSSSPRTDFYPSAVVKERHWEHLLGAWKEVSLHRMKGRNFLNQIELLMAALTAQT